jgi:hypothetical protein
MKTQTLSTSAMLAALLLSGCGGGTSSGSNIPSANQPSLSQPQSSEEGIAATNAAGVSAKSLTDFNTDTVSPIVSTQTDVRGISSAGSGVCHNGQEFWAPDKNGTTNSTETQYFYDSACTQLARDMVRVYTPIGTNAETLSRTTTLYPSGSASASAVRTDSVVILNAQFNAFGFPLAATGYSRSVTGELNLAGVKTIVSDNEIVMAPASGAVNAFCGDSAGYNATGFAALNATLGWNSVLSGATRTVHSDGSITYAMTHAGTAFSGPIGSLSIAPGAQNSACPISKPMFTLAGGTALGSYNYPVVVTYMGGIIQNFSITNGQAANGDTINASTNTSLPPTNPQYITATITNPSAVTVATIAVDAFGDGSVTIVSSGKQFTITDWHVVK